MSTPKEIVVSINRIKNEKNILFEQISDLQNKIVEKQKEILILDNSLISLRLELEIEAIK